LDSAIRTRLATALVSTYASAVWAWRIPPGTLPAVGAKPIVAFETRLTREPTDNNDSARMDIEVVVIDHIDNAPSQSQSAVEQVLAQMHRWVPTVSGIGTSAIAEVEQVRGEWDETHIAHVISYETIVSEG
jgi:hypothetical protein